MADAYIEGLHAFMLRIAALGITGIPRSHISPGLRLMIYKAHTIYFRVSASSIFVVRILHGAQDTSRHLGSTE